MNWLARETLLLQKYRIWVAAKDTTEVLVNLLMWTRWFTNLVVSYTGLTLQNVEIQTLGEISG